ncbi:MAG: hypothetical protein HWN81_00380 [Candidatus Lokiarchaeota archaeon]|nr:hypothetical protein [Candidatus Lokiarchaeota archaeon]
MARGNYTDKEFDLLDRLKKENKRLKRDLKATRKMLDRYSVAEEKGLIDEGAIMPSKKRQKEKELQEKWKCHDCEKGVLELIIIGNRYFRKCNNCDKHTKSQLWDESVKGVIKGEGKTYKK